MKGALLLLALLVVAVASASGNRHIHLAGRSTSTVDLKSHNEAGATTAHPEAEIFAQWIVQLRGPVKPAARAAVEELLSAGEPHSYHLGAYVPHNSYVLVAPRHVADKAATSEHVLWVGRWEREYRLVDGKTKAYETAAEHEPLSLTVLLAADLPEATGSIAARWAMALSEAFGGGSDDVTFSVALPGELEEDGLLTVHRLSGNNKEGGVSHKSTRAIVEWLAAQPETHFIEPLSGQQMRFMAQLVNELVQSGNDSVDPTPYWSEGFNGTGALIGIVDSGVDYQHCFFENAVGGAQPTNAAVPDLNNRKIATYYNTVNNKVVGDFSDNTGHGSIVAGVAAGQPLSDTDPSNAERGVAFAAKLVVLDIVTATAASGALAPPSDYRGTLRALQRSSVDIVINAFGVNGTGTGYSSLDAGLDTILSADNDILVVVSAGNDVAGSRELTSPGRAKNALTVGESLNYNIAFQDAYIAGDYTPSQQMTDNRDDTFLYSEKIVDGDSPRGLTVDGRIKPDLVAPGRPVRSARANQGVDSCSTTTAVHGSSVSAGVVAGLAAVLRSAFAPLLVIPGRGAPSGVLLKAMLINSGQSLLRAGLQSNGGGDFAQAASLPNSVSGWGVPNLQSMGLINDTHVRSSFALDRVPTDFSGLNTGEVARYCMDVNSTTPATNSFRATLAWYDTAGVVGTGIALVNNLDLVVMRPDGSLVYANGLNTYDGVNTVEQISLGAGQFPNGQYRIYVIGTNVPQPPKLSDGSTNGQYFALFATGDDFNTPSNSDDSCLSAVCPNACGGSQRGSCDTATGSCTCQSGFSGIDCTQSACSPACSLSQRCDYNTLTCVTTDTTQIVVDRRTKRTGITAGILAGSLVGVCVICCILCLLVGFCLAVGAMEARRWQYKRKILAKRKAQMGE